MKTRIQVIFNDAEWAGYTLSFGVAKRNHYPTVPPSYPVLVLSSEEPTDIPNESDIVRHSFVEMDVLKLALGTEKM